jgi:Domain of unknown function (DUF4158)
LAVSKNFATLEFLSDQEASAYGVYWGVPSQSDLEKLFFLDDPDRQLIAKTAWCAQPARVGAAAHDVRYLGVFLPDPLDVPDGAAGYLAGQLKISDLAVSSATPNVARCGSSMPTRSGPPAGCASPIRRTRSCGSGWTRGPGRPKAIFLDAVRWLRERDVLLPGVTVLTRLVAQVRDEACQRL